VNNLELDRKIRTYMDSIVSEFVDPRTGEVSLTELAEEACEEFDLYEDGSSIPEDLFEVAFEIADDYHKTRKVGRYA